MFVKHGDNYILGPVPNMGTTRDELMRLEMNGGEENYKARYIDMIHTTSRIKMFFLKIVFIFSKIISIKKIWSLMWLSPACLGCLFLLDNIYRHYAS